MKRLILTLAAALLGTGCIVDADDDDGFHDGDYADVLVYWDFVRNAPAQPGGYVIYDGTLEGLRGACPESGVDVVEITVAGTRYTFDCIEPNGVQGVWLLDVPAGTRSFRVTGWRGAVAAYESVVTYDVFPGDDEGFLVDVEPVTAPIDLVAYLVNDGADGVAGTGDDFDYVTCGEAMNPTLRLELWDSFDTKIIDDQFACGAPGDRVDPLYVLETAAYELDLDGYVARLRGYEGATQTFDSCGQAFDHFQAQVGVDGEVVLESYTAPPACSFQ